MLHDLPGLVLLLVLLISLITDLRSRNIYNWVTLPAIGSGILWHAWRDGWSGFVNSGEGFLLGLGLLLIPYLLGGMGAGDVKLMAAIGALTGPAFVFSSFLYSSLIGGMIALAILLYRGEWKRSLHRIGMALLVLRTHSGALQALDKRELHGAFPYGVAITFGTLAAFVWGGTYAF